jgi:hypothetical protein
MANALASSFIILSEENQKAEDKSLMDADWYVIHL